MKKYWLTATTLGAVAALSLTACSSGGESTDATTNESSANPTSTATPTTVPTETGQLQFGSDADVAALKAVTWAEADGQPTLEFDAPLSLTASATYVMAEGTGDTISVGDNVDLDIVAYSGADQSAIGSTYENGSSETYTMTDGAIDPALYAVLVGNKVGQTLIYGTPDAQNAPTDGSETPAVLYAVTVNSATTVPDRASGAPVDPAEGLPSVTLGENGAPAVDFAGADKPSELVSQTLITGDGAEVTADQTITAHYTGWVWDGEQFDSSWDKGSPLTISLAQLVPGWQQGLAGQAVGSQVLLVIPPELGYGDQESGTIPANSTLVFVVDILAAS